MSDIESDLKLDNWLSIVSFDLHKYIKAGGQVSIDETEGGLRVQFAGVTLDDSRLHRKFRALHEDEK